MKKCRFLWSAHRITERQKAGKSRSIKGKQLKNSRNTVSKPLVELRSSPNDNFSSLRDNQKNDQNVYKTSETLCFWGFSLPMHPGEMLRNVVELCGYVARVHHVCSKNHSNYVVGFLMKQRGIRKADTSKIFILLISAFFCLYTFLPFSLCRNREDFMRKMKESGWDVNWSDKRKHIVFQNQDGKKVRERAKAARRKNRRRYDPEL